MTPTYVLNLKSTVYVTFRKKGVFIQGSGPSLH